MTGSESLRSARRASNQDRVLESLAEYDNEGSDRGNIVARTGLTAAQVSAALQGLRRKGLAACGRWHDTSVWWRT